MTDFKPVLTKNVGVREEPYIPPSGCLSGIPSIASSSFITVNDLCTPALCVSGRSVTASVVTDYDFDVTAVIPLRLLYGFKGGTNIT